MPATDNMNLWFGTLFIHKGYYRNAVFKFVMTIPPEYPEKRPTVHFVSDIFHPLIDQQRELVLQYQFPTWTPHQDYLFHVLHFIKACFKKCILDRTTEKQAVNKVAYRMYRHEPTIFAKLAQQSAQLSITEQKLYEHHPPNNSIKFSPLSDPEFASTIDRMTDNVKRTPTGIPIPGPEKKGRPEWAMDPENLDKEMNQVPLFMQRLTAEALENPLIQALQELAYDGTPEEVAENFKNQGNECFKQGKKYYKDALDYYTKALDVGCSDDKLNETLYVNRAACNLHFENYRRVLTDCAAALKLNPKNVKALYRSAKALAALEMYPEAIDCCEHALVNEPDNKLVQEEKKRIQAEYDVKEAKRKAKEERERKIREQKLKIEGALEKRGIKTASTPGYTKNHPHDIQLNDETGEISIPTFFLYPEHNESDFVQAFHEHDTVGEQLAEIFYEPAPWDPQHKYRPETVEIYFETEDAGGNVGLMKVGLKVKLITILKHQKHVLKDQLARLIVVPKEDSQWKKDWLAKYGK
ncbi:hypothetical protein BGW42_008488 [Actinomortierella wolfii]|nr:hypothetical protein BGW42_008488 [Actinomortierella wolfii]